MKHTYFFITSENKSGNVKLYTVRFHPVVKEDQRCWVYNICLCMSQRNQIVFGFLLFVLLTGLYISENNENVNEEFCGQGIRIEDNILVTESNPILLTRFCPKEPEVIESLVGTSKT